MKGSIIVIIMSIIVIIYRISIGVSIAKKGGTTPDKEHGTYGILTGLALGISISILGDCSIFGGVFLTILILVFTLFLISGPVTGAELRYSKAQEIIEKEEKEEDDRLKEETINKLLSKDRSTMSLSDKIYTDSMLFVYGKAKTAELKGWFYRDTEATQYVRNILEKEVTNANIDIQVQLVREDDNIHDENALKVITTDGLFIGYIPRDRALQIRSTITPTKYPYGIIEYCKNNTLIILIKLGVYETPEDCQQDIIEIENKEYNRNIKQIELQKSLIEDQCNLEKGLLYEAEGRYEDAINIYSKLVDNDTTLNRAYERLCILLRKTNRLEDELWAAEKWLEYVNNQNNKETTQIINVKKRLTYIQSKLYRLNS